MTKFERHRKILELISERVVSTQTELTDLLTDAGFDVTQATTSRDLQELRIIKVLLGDGTYKYTVSKDTDSDVGGKLRKILGECLANVDYAMNIVVLKTMTGAAQAVAFALESEWGGVKPVGTGNWTLQCASAPSEPSTRADAGPRCSCRLAGHRWLWRLGAPK